MAAFFASASSQKLLNSVAPITAIPFTVGIWVFPTTAGTNRAFWSLADTGTTNNFFSIEETAVSTWSLSCAAGGSSAVMTSLGTVTANQWAFIIARAIGAANRRLSVLQFDGSIGAGQETTSLTPAGIDALALGCRNVSTPSTFMDGSVANYWLTNTDIQLDGGALDATLLRQLAFGGPFSVPSVARDLIEYRSLRKSTIKDQIGEVYYSQFGVQTWTDTGGVILAADPLIPYWYRRPTDISRGVMI